MSRSEDDALRAGERAAIAQDVLEKLGRESLKKEIVEELKAEGGKEKKDFTQNPLLLLIIGFILTGLVGSWLTSFWKSKEFDEQQLKASHQRIIEQKYAVTDRLTKAVAEAYIGAEDILYLAENGWKDEVPGEKAPPRATNWLQASRNWRLNDELLKHDIAVNFRNAKAQPLFEKMENDWALLSNDLDPVRDWLRANRWREIKPGDKLKRSDGSVVDLNEYKEEAEHLLKSMLERNEELLKLMLDEIHEDVRKPDVAYTENE